MGAWGPGLYSSDLAMDLRPLISALARLPIPDGDIRRYAADATPGVAEDAANEDYTTFWLVLADQFAKKGIDCAYTRQRALQIIESGADIAMMRELKMEERDLRKRQKNLEAIRELIVMASNTPKKSRKTLAKPQPLVMEKGDCLVYPTQRGQPINPYFPGREAQGWVQDGWASALVLETGYALGYLAWYRLASVLHGAPDKPGLQDILDGRMGGAAAPGTCSPAHFKRMEMERLGRLDLNDDVVRKILPGVLGSGSADMAAIHDISISNGLMFGAGHNGGSGPTVADLLQDSAQPRP
jgi:hypothetical protein